MPTAYIFLHSCEHCVHATVYSAFYHMYYVLNIWQIAIVITAIFNNCENSMEWMGYNILSCSLIINSLLCRSFLLLSPPLPFSLPLVHPPTLPPPSRPPVFSSSFSPLPHLLLPYPFCSSLPL